MAALIDSEAVIGSGDGYGYGYDSGDGYGDGDGYGYGCDSDSDDGYGDGYDYASACVAVPKYFRLTELADIAKLHGLRLVWNKTARRLEERP